MEREPRGRPTGGAPPERSPRASLAFGGLQAATWIATAFVLMLLGALVVAAFDADALGDMVTLGALSSATFLLTSALLLGRFPGGARLRDAVGLRPTHPLLPPLGLVLGAAAQVPAEALQRLAARFVPEGEEAARARIAMLEPRGVAHAVALALVIAILVPLAEEVFFRGAVFGALRRGGRSALAAGVITALGFTASHPDLGLLLPIGAVAALLSALRGLSGSLWPSLAAHVGFNAVTIVGAVTGARPLTDAGFSAELSSAAYGALLGCGALFAWLGLVSPAAAESRAAEQEPHAD
jgi:hypothetical protein